MLSFLMKEFNDVVHVYARSIGGQVRPLQFIYKGKRFSISTVERSQKQVIGNSTYYFFTVRIIPFGVAELVFELNIGQWTLVRGEFDTP